MKEIKMHIGRGALGTLLVIIIWMLIPQTAGGQDYERKESHRIEIPAPLHGIPEKLLYRKAYTVSYNHETRCPNWVAWHLTSEKVQGQLKRISSKAFREDPDVASPRATLSDYRGSGYDRGHMCPVGDNKWDKQAMYETFLLTNICPQDKALNSGVWNEIEIQCRDWARRHGDVYIVCGPIYTREEHITIGDSKVWVPEAFFKVILCLSDTPKAIGFVCRNEKGNRRKAHYVNSIDEVERITGIDFFPSLPDNIERQVEAHADLSEWR